MGPLERLWHWLEGYRRTETLCERKPVWAPLAVIWAPPGGIADFKYEATSSAEISAEVMFFATAGFGGASKRKLKHSFSHAGISSSLSYDTIVFITAYRYVNHRSGASFDRIDVDCAANHPADRSSSPDPKCHPLRGTDLAPAEIEAQGYAIARRLLLANASGGDVTVETSADEQKSWKFSISVPEVPSLAAGVEIGGSVENATGFVSKFHLAVGHDYAFCSRRGETPVVPLCVRLRPGDAG